MKSYSVFTLMHSFTNKNDQTKVKKLVSREGEIISALESYHSSYTLRGSKRRLSNEIT